MADDQDEWADPVGHSIGLLASMDPGARQAEFQRHIDALQELGLMPEPEPVALLLTSLARQLDYFFKSTLFLAVYGVAIVATGLLSWAAYHLPEGFGQSLMIELASGIAMFLAIPVVIRSGRWAPQRTGFVVLAASAICCLGSMSTEGVSQSLLLEASVGLLLAAALDLGWTALEKWAAKARLDADPRRA